METHEPTRYRRELTDEQLQRAQVVPDIAGRDLSNGEVAGSQTTELSLLPADIYAGAGISREAEVAPDISYGQARVEAMRRIIAYQAELTRRRNLLEATITPVESKTSGTISANE
ncbi:MAG TPA: hypothetical protein VK694_05275 [Verrucomicrobiae bacterium]|nr:hypothetical protein [Verrucomicrobiae bacterium]